MPPPWQARDLVAAIIFFIVIIVVVRVVVKITVVVEMTVVVTIFLIFIMTPPRAPTHIRHNVSRIGIGTRRHLNSMLVRTRTARYRVAVSMRHICPRVPLGTLYGLPHSAPTAVG